MDSLFSGLITSKTRIRLLMRLFLNPEQKVYLRGLSDEFSISPSQAGGELQNLSAAGFLSKEKSGRQVFYKANQSHPMFPELQSMVRKSLGMEHILESILSRLGNLRLAFIVGDYAEGKDSGLIDLVLVGDINQTNLNDLVRKAEKYIHRKIRTLSLAEDELAGNLRLFEDRTVLVLWDSDAK